MSLQSAASEAAVRKKKLEERRNKRQKRCSGDKRKYFLLFTAYCRRVWGNGRGKTEGRFEMLFREMKVRYREGGWDISEGRGQQNIVRGKGEILYSPSYSSFLVFPFFLITSSFYLVSPLVCSLCKRHCHFFFVFFVALISFWWIRYNEIILCFIFS